MIISLALLLLNSMGAWAVEFTKSHYSVVLQGACIYANSWEEGEDYTPMGIYQMSEKDGFNVVPFKITQKIVNSNGGGAFIGDEFYCVWNQEDPTSSFAMNQIIRWNLATGERENLGICDDNLVVTTAGTAVDPQTGLVYGIFWDSSNKTTRELGIVDYPNMERTTIATIDRALYGLCIDKNGQMYAVDSNGNLVKVDKDNGEITVVGQTGIKPKYLQAAVVDTYTNKMYWNAITSKEAWICEVDLATGETTKLAQLPDENEFSVLRVLPPAAADKAPAPVTNLATEFIDANTTGTIFFTMPDETFDGTPITQQLTYTVANADGKLAEGTAAPGEQVTQQIATTQGEHCFTVVASNEEGNSPADSIRKYVGYDTPKAPTKVTLAIDEMGHATLSWQAPTEGVHGGYIDGDNLTYSIFRQSEEERIDRGVTDTQWEETLQQESASAYLYNVTADNHGLESEKAMSNSVVYGGGLPIPWSCTFDDAASLALFTIIDANNDENTWRWTKYHNGAAYYAYSKTNDADDWLISPPLALEANKSYTIKFENEVLKDCYPEKMELRYGQGSDTDNYEVVMPVTTFINDSYTTNTFSIRPQQDGDYRLAFHIVSDANEGTMAIDNLKVDFDASDNIQTMTSTPHTDHTVFDLSGRKVNGKDLRPGVYIVDGKKVVVTK